MNNAPTPDDERTLVNLPQDMSEAATMVMDRSQLDIANGIQLLSIIGDELPSLTVQTSTLINFIDSAVLQKNVTLLYSRPLGELITSVAEALIYLKSALSQLKPGYVPELVKLSASLLKACEHLMEEERARAAEINTSIAAAEGAMASITAVMINDVKPSQESSIDMTTSESVGRIESWVKQRKDEFPIQAALIAEFNSFASKVNTGHNDFIRGNFSDELLGVFQSVKDILATEDQFYSEILSDLQYLLSFIAKTMREVSGSAQFNADKFRTLAVILETEG